MPKLTTINVPTKKGHSPRTGFVAWFNVGDTRVKFFIHREIEWEGEEFSILSHYASGYQVGSFAAMRVGHFVSSGGSSLPPRDAAEIFLSRIIANNGADKVLSSLAAVPVINS